jgi:aminomethyltransferase
MSNSLKHTPLFQWHVNHGAKTADFGGWDMPIEYVGIVAEHIAVRTDVGVFDVSHMGKIQIQGVGAAQWLNTVVASDLDLIPFGKAQYSMLLNSTGGVIDDLIVYKFASDHVWIVPNASNASAVVAVLESVVPADISITNLHNSHGIVAIQGPRSTEVLAALNLPSDHEYMSAVFATYGGLDVVLCRSGYTGERGYEVIAPNEVVEALWIAAVAAGATPAGLGARDTLRLEMGYPLHGHEITTEISPLEAGLSWAIGWDKPVFHGSEALKAQKQSGAPRKRVAVKALERGIPRADMPVEREGVEIGITTSGTFSPSLKEGIALALTSPDVKIGDHLQLNVRGRLLAVEVVRLPFVQPSTK